MVLEGRNGFLFVYFPPNFKDKGINMNTQNNPAEHRLQREPRKHTDTHPESKPLSNLLDPVEPEINFLTETRFQPSLSRHAALLSGHNSKENKAGLLLELQRSYGNNYVQRLLEKIKVQAQLTVSNPGDPCEQEAERVASEVSSALSAGIQRQELPEEEELQTKSNLQIQKTEMPEEEVILQAQPVDNQVEEVTEDLEERINRARGTGQPLSDIAQKPMESVFGTDFSGVRVHTGTEADTLNRQLNARAFTTGQDIFFREGEYNPGSGSGQRLIAHELTHVVQQTGNSGLRRNLKNIARSGQVQMESEQKQILQSTEGALPDYELEEGLEKGPHGKFKRYAENVVNDANDSAGEKLSIKPNLNLNFNDTETINDHAGQAGGHRKINVVWSNPGGASVDPYGAEFFQPGYKNLKWKKTGNSLYVDVTLDVKCPWGVNGGGNINVSSAADPVVTADSSGWFGNPVYKKIAKDLTPVKKEKCWVEPSEKYWSQAIAERHEKYHSTDDKQWVEGPGLQVVKNYMEGSRVTSDNITQQLVTLMNNAITKLETANWEFYTGGASSYYSYAGEIRAYGDSREPLMKLVKEILERGEKLKKEAKSKK
jgi:hypothetical protein